MDMEATSRKLDFERGTSSKKEREPPQVRGRGEEGRRRRGGDAQKRWLANGYPESP